MYYQSEVFILLVHFLSVQLTFTQINSLVITVKSEYAYIKPVITALTEIVISDFQSVLPTEYQPLVYRKDIPVLSTES